MHIKFSSLAPIVLATFTGCIINIEINKNG